MNFKITVTPDDGMYKRGVFVFDSRCPRPTRTTRRRCSARRRSSTRTSTWRATSASTSCARTGSQCSQYRA